MWSVFFVQIYFARGRFRLIQIICTCWEAINKGGEYSGPTLSGDSLKGKPCLKAGCRNHTFHSWLNHVESYRGSRSPIDTGAWAYTSLAHTPWGSADGAGARERERETVCVCVCVCLCWHVLTVSIYNIETDIGYTVSKNRVFPHRCTTCFQWQGTRDSKLQDVQGCLGPRFRLW